MVRIPLGFILVILSLFPVEQEKKGIIRMKAEGISETIASVDSIEIHFNDTLTDHFLFIHRDQNNLPLTYSRKITTGVCIDGGCRLVQIELYWTNSGRYQGFRLSNGEYLSKTEHEPFKAEEYDQLHDLLGKANSPLANFELKELVVQKNTLPDEIDGISSATLKSILNHVVEGAVYTTYTLWHIIYGPTRHEIQRISSQNLTADLALKVLQSDQTKEKIWILNQLSGDIHYSADLTELLIEIIGGEDIYLSERALHALPNELLTRNTQLSLARFFTDSRLIKQRWIIYKLKEANTLEQEIITALLQNIEESRTSIVRATLSLLSQHKVFSPSVYDRILPLLNHSSQAISDIAFKYLDQIETPNKKCIRELEKYRKRNTQVNWDCP